MFKNKISMFPFRRCSHSDVETSNANLQTYSGEVTGLLLTSETLH